jgi:inhibitor-of-growth protein 1
VREAAYQTENWKRIGNDNPARKARGFARMQQALIAAQELGDEKMNLLQSILDKIEIKTRLLDQDFKNLGKCVINCVTF